MRKVKFFIDDFRFFQKEWNVTEEQMKDIFKSKNSFKVIYTLYSKEKDEKSIDRYTLFDYDGNKVNYNGLNCYQRGVILNDCMAYFYGGKYSFDADKPCGVIRIVDSKI